MNLISYVIKFDSKTENCWTSDALVKVSERTISDSMKCVITKALNMYYSTLLLYLIWTTFIFFKLQAFSYLVIESSLKMHRANKGNLFRVTIRKMCFVPLWRRQSIFSSSPYPKHFLICRSTPNFRNTIWYLLGLRICNKYINLLNMNTKSKLFFFSLNNCPNIIYIYILTVIFRHCRARVARIDPRRVTLYLSVAWLGCHPSGSLKRARIPDNSKGWDDVHLVNVAWQDPCQLQSWVVVHLDSLVSGVIRASCTADLSSIWTADSVSRHLSTAEGGMTSASPDFSVKRYITVAQLSNHPAG